MVQHRSPLLSVALATLLFSSSQALVGPTRVVRPLHSSAIGVSASLSPDEVSAAAGPASGASTSADETAATELTPKAISGLRFRELKRELHARGLEDDGTTSQLRNRLRAAVLPGYECVVREDGQEECGPDVLGVSTIAVAAAAFSVHLV